MAPKVIKRPAAAASAKAEPKSPKKARVAAVPAVNYPLIVDAVMTAEELPEQVRRMICVNVENCLSVPKDKRVAPHEKAISWISEGLKLVQKRLQRRIEAAETEVADADSEKAKRLQAENEAQEAKLANIEALAAKKEAAAAADVEKKQATNALNEALHAQKSGEKELEQLVSEKNLLEDCLESAFAQLKAGGLEEAEAKQKVDVLMAAAKDLDQSMLTSLPSALKKDPSSRGTFDNMVVDSIEEELKKRISGAAEAIAGGDAVRKDLALKVEAAQAAENSAMEASTAAQEAVKGAQAECEQANVAVKSAAQSMKEFLPTVKEAAMGLEAENQNLSVFSEGPLALFHELEAAISAELAAERAAAAEAEAEAAKKAAEAEAAEGDAEAEDEAEAEGEAEAATADVAGDVPGADA